MAQIRGQARREVTALAFHIEREMILGFGATLGLVFSGRSDEVVGAIRTMFDTYEVCLT
jgi:hypothetical protein